MKKVCFIGHRYIDVNIEDRLKLAIKNQIDLGYKTFVVGHHGQFDQLTLTLLQHFQKSYDINIEIVVTSLNQIYKKQNISKNKNIKFVLYDVEETYFKKQIVESNKQMIDDCQCLICYINPKKNKSGAKTIYNSPAIVLYQDLSRW